MQRNYRFIELLSQKYPNVQRASSEIINLNAILNLPKGTEHFLSDLHGEYEAFNHILKNASGVIKKKIDERFDKTLTKSERTSFATLIYYPVEKLYILKKENKNTVDWYRINLYRLIDICRVVASKYTRSKVRKALPKDFSYVIEELLHEHNDFQNKEKYYTGIIETIINTQMADSFIISLSKLIQRLAVDRLHIIGDIFDRGPGAEIIMETLMTYHCVDIEWGNHDVLWMGAAAGNTACIATVLRIAARYSNLETIEDGYGISIRPLVTFALEKYKNDNCEKFMPIAAPDTDKTSDMDVIAKVHKAIAIIQFKLEGEIIKRNPNYELEHRLLLDNTNFKTGEISIYNEMYKLNDTNFPTIDAENSYKLTDEEIEVVEKLKQYFLHSEKLQKHTKFLFANGGMYDKINGNLLYHGCIPIDENGEFLKFDNCSGMKLFDYADKLLRRGYFLNWDDENKTEALDFYWYMWSGSKSPLFGKDKMTTFERYFIDDKETWKENKNPYYSMLDNEEFINRILEEFGFDKEKAKIINGHVPVLQKKGEHPIKANGKLFVIDGGLSKSYQNQTGIAGYTLIFNSHGFLLTSHQPLSSTIEAIEKETDIFSKTMVVEQMKQRVLVSDTDVGKDLKEQILDLEELVLAYKKGIIKEIYK